MIFKEGMEGIVADPCLIPQHVLAEMTDFLQYLLDVIDRPVIGRELDTGEPERTIQFGPSFVFDKRMLRDPLAQVAWSQGVPVHGADHANGFRAVGR